MDDEISCSVVPACFQEHLPVAFKIGLCGSTAGWCISHLSSVLHPRHPCFFIFFLFGHSSKSKHLFSGRIGIISILNSLRVETLLIGSTCPSMSQLFPSASIISWKSWSFSASVESTNWPEGCNELHHHSESLRVSELINPNLKNEHSLMFSEQTKRPHGKPPGGSTARSKTSEFIFKSPWPKHPSFPAVNLWLGALRKGVARCWTYKTTMS